MPPQLQSLPAFDGKRGEGFINWLETLETARVTYRWPVNALVQVAKAKGGSAVVEWDQGNRLRVINVQVWVGPGQLKEMLSKRFKPKFTAPTAVNAVSDLKQKPRESCTQFLDRAVLAVNRQNFNIPEIQKTTTIYHSVFDASIISHFEAGLKDEISSGCESIKKTINSTNFWHNLIFIKNLQVPCNLRMDFLSKAGISIDTTTNKVRLGKSKLANGQTYSAYPVKDVSLPAKSETLVTLTSPGAFKQGLIKGSLRLPENVMLMEGIVTSSSAKSFTAVFANFHHLPVKLTTNDKVGRLHIDEQMTAQPIDHCLVIQDGKPQLTNPKDFHHVDKIPLDRIPLKFQNDYRAILRSYTDVFSKNDLDLELCKVLPHQVRLIVPNRITAINQYGLPHHLGKVAIDYVKKLLAAGVIRKSNSVFNSPLMIVKKPHADPKKPFAEQYRLVHNYVEVNKNIAPCSYPLRHLYELLDEVASGRVYSVLDLSQGFFQQHLIDPHEATAFSIPGVGQYAYLRSPQGMNSSPAYFQRLLDCVLKGIERTYVYIDDVVISVQNHEQNLAKLKEVFNRFRKHNLKIKPSKCQFGIASITYLGYDICAEKGITPGQQKQKLLKTGPVLNPSGKSEDF